MVIDISYSSMSLEEFCDVAHAELNEAIHEAKMSLLMAKYNYLQENGVVMEEAEEKDNIFIKIKAVVQKFIGMAVAMFEKLKDKLARKIKELKENHDQKKAERAYRRATKLGDFILSKFTKHAKKVMNKEDYDDFNDAMNDLRSGFSEYEDDIKSCFTDAYREFQ